jgi:hypothetical protein
MPLRTPSNRSTQTGNAISLLLGLLAVGLLFYFMLKPGHSTAPAAGGDVGAPPAGANMVSCEQQVAKLVQTTGGIGSEAQAAYDKLPPQCQRMMPNPAASAPIPQDAPEEAK